MGAISSRQTLPGSSSTGISTSVGAALTFAALTFVAVIGAALDCAAFGCVAFVGAEVGLEVGLEVGSVELLGAEFFGVEFFGAAVGGAAVVGLVAVGLVEGGTIAVGLAKAGFVAVGTADGGTTFVGAGLLLQYVVETPEGGKIVLVSAPAALVALARTGNPVEGMFAELASVCVRSVCVTRMPALFSKPRCCRCATIRALPPSVSREGRPGLFPAAGSRHKSTKVCPCERAARQPMPLSSLCARTRVPAMRLSRASACCAVCRRACAFASAASSSSCSCRASSSSSPAPSLTVSAFPTLELWRGKGFVGSSSSAPTNALGGENCPVSSIFATNASKRAETKDCESGACEETDSGKMPCLAEF